MNNIVNAIYFCLSHYQPFHIYDFAFFTYSRFGVCVIGFVASTLRKTKANKTDKIVLETGATRFATSRKEKTKS